MKTRMTILLAAALFFGSMSAKDSPKQYDMSISVLDVKQVPFTSGGSNSSVTNCHIYGNTIYCDTQNMPSSGINGVSYLMLATASDGNTYLFGCSAQWRWSKCAGLETGSFKARRTNQGSLAVLATFGKKEKEVTYDIFQTHVTQK